MNKTKNRNLHLPLVITGYTAFALLVASTLISTTIPFGKILFTEGVRTGNVTVLLISLTLGAILPVLVGYLVGDHAVRSKSRLSHHFNGVLFGLLGLWMMIFMGAFIGYVVQHDGPIGWVLSGLLPSVLVAVVATALAIAHVRSSSASRDLIEYMPFVYTLIVATIAMPVSSIVQGVATSSLSWNTFVAAVLIVIFGAIAYVSLRKTKFTALVKVGWSTVAISVLYALYMTSIFFTSSIEAYVLESGALVSAVLGSVTLVAAVAGWIIYWVYQVRGFSAKKRK